MLPVLDKVAKLHSGFVDQRCSRWSYTPKQPNQHHQYYPPAYIHDVKLSM